MTFGRVLGLKLVADANVLFSALLRSGATRRLWFNPENRLFAPRFLVQEALSKRGELLKKYSGSSEEFDRLQSLHLRQVTLISDEELLPFLPAAASLSSDPKDWLYLACALYKDAGIWTHDKEFQKQARIKIYSTESLMEELVQ